MRDIGLMTGVKALWQEDLLWDYTIKVQGQEFKAHKVVLASVSQYFKAMLNQSFMESNMDEIELKGLSADVVSKVLKFIYTGDEDIIRRDALEILKCVIYLQMPLVADVCVEKLLEELHYKTCLNIYSVFMEYSFLDEAEKVSDFIEVNWEAVFEVCKLEDLSHYAVQVLMDYWQKSEWEMFMFVNEWYCADPEDHRSDVNELLTRVRFCLISEERVKSVTEKRVFTNTEGSWHELVQLAIDYHQLPTHLKVLEQSDQSKVKSDPSPVFFNTGFCEDSSTFFGIDEKNKWRKYEKKAQNVPKFGEPDRPIGIEVNNYFVIWTGARTQKWHIFDPRTMKWSKMADMEDRRRGFVILQHGEHLYTIGGSTRTLSHDPQSLTKYIYDHVRVMEQYSFRENTWSSLTVPYSFSGHAACVLGDNIYVGGGHIQDANGEESVKSLYSLDLSSPSQEWERKADFTVFRPALESHEMFVVRIKGEEVVLVVLNDMYLYYYSPAKDKWTYFIYTVEKKYEETFFHIHGMMLARDNTLYVLNVQLNGFDSDGSDSEHYEEQHMRDRICLKWEIPKRGRHITNVPLEIFPLSPRPSRERDVKIFGAILAIPL